MCKTDMKVKLEISRAIDAAVNPLLVWALLEACEADADPDAEAEGELEPVGVVVSSPASDVGKEIECVVVVDVVFMAVADVGKVTEGGVSCGAEICDEKVETKVVVVSVRAFEIVGLDPDLNDK